MTNGVLIQYGAIAPEAKESFSYTPSEKAFDTVDQLKEYNLVFPKYANPCELYQTPLDGTALALPAIPESANLGFWSEQISGDDGEFEKSIKMTLIANESYSSEGLTFTFDTDNNIYCTRVLIEWLRDEQSLSKIEFIPDNPIYFCENSVENYNNIDITFYSINMPKNRLKLKSIDFGYGTVFVGKELRNVQCIQELDPISSHIPVSTTDIILDSKSNRSFSFQSKQPLKVYYNGKIISTSFVRSAVRKSKNIWDIRSEDYIGLMEKVPYSGGIYDGDNAYSVLEEIFNVAKVPFVINDDLKHVYLYGHIPYTTCREALMQVAFAVQNVVDTSGSEYVSVKELSEEIIQVIPLDRIMQGQEFSENDIVTGVEVVEHSYKPTSETVTIYDAEKSGVGEDITIKFSEPLYDIEITNGSFAVDSNSNYMVNSNYCVIHADRNCLVTGKRYEHITKSHRQNRDDVTATTTEKVISISNATLVSSSNIDTVLKKCYNWLAKTSYSNFRIVEGKKVKYGNPIKYGERLYGEIRYGETEKNTVEYDMPVSLGDKIQAQTEYLEDIVGIITRQSFNLNGGIVIKEVAVK